MRIDLHTHSTVSDGTLSPAGVMEAAAAAGLDVVALTDHDTLRGWLAAAQAAGRLGLEFVPGVEMSCRWYGVEPAIPLHLLGYYVDAAQLRCRRSWPGSATRVSTGPRDGRANERGRGGHDLARGAGYAAGGSVGRPHLAQALIRRWLRTTVNEAFAPSMLGPRWRLPKADMDVFEAVGLVRGAGGVAVFAHLGRPAGAG